MGASKKVLIIIASCAVLVATAIVGYALLFPNKLHPTVTVEAGIEKLVPADFIKKDGLEGTFVTNIAGLNLRQPGVHTIEIQIGKRVYSSKLQVVDTIAPTAEVVNHEIWAGDQLTADQFVQNVEDVTDVTITFGQEPDFNKVGQQEVYITLEDSSGNKTDLTAQLTIIQDTEPPVILGAQNQTVYVDAKVAYRKDITVVDNRDEQVQLVVDSSAVNIKKPGKYPVIYSATDAAGNTTSITVEFTVITKPKDFYSEEEVFAKADKVLAEILQEGMTEVDKAWAIYTWVKKHLSFVGTSDKSDWIQGAARGFNRATGDCFVYYALSRALLTRAGFENLCVEKSHSVGPPRHYWNLVKVDGNWYHFDTCPHYRGYPYRCFLRTDAEVKEYSEWCKDYYTFDEGKYPATPLEPLDIEQNK